MENSIKLTQLVSCAGCAAKIPPNFLKDLTEGLPVFYNDKVIIDFKDNDDTSVTEIDGDLCLVHTLDFFTPIVDSPFDYGYIAANNAVNDIYAMGAKPLEALNIVCFPVNDVKQDILREILKGGAQLLFDHKIPLLGGHSVRDKEIKYGLAVTGLVKKDEIMANKYALEGDIIYITKPIGSGIISTLKKFDKIDNEKYNFWVNSLKQSNALLSEILVRNKIKACTDISGFGVIGHLSEVMNASGFSFEIDIDKIPLFNGAYEGYIDGFAPGGLMTNYEFYKQYVVNCIDEEDKINYNKFNLLFDPQTSGGFAIFVSPEKKEKLEKEFIENNIEFYQIGRVINREEKNKIYVRGKN